MTVAPLYAPQYTKLRTPGYAADRLLSLFSNRVLLSGTIDTDLAATANWAEFDYIDTFGDYTDCLDGMVLLIGTVNDIKLATFRGRLRGSPSSGTITCNESSQNFGTGSFFWVIDTRDIGYVLSRPSSLDPATAEELINYDQEYEGLLPRMVGLQTGYVGYVKDDDYLRLGFDLSQSEAAESGETISSYLSVIPDAILRAGGFDESIFIVDIPYGERWGQSTVTDSADLALTRYFGIKVHDPELYPPDTGFEGGTIAAQLDAGYTLTIPAFADVDDVLYNTFGIAWRANQQFSRVDGGLYDANSADVTNKALTSNVVTLTAAGHPFEVGQTLIIADVDAAINGTHTITSVTTSTFSFPLVHANIASAACSGMAVCNPVNVDFVGWFNREDDSLQGDVVRSVSSGAKFVFTGVGPRLARLTAQLIAIQQSDAPSRWGDIKNATPWRAIWHFWSRYTTVATLCDIAFDDTSDTYLFPEMSSQGGNALRACQDIASQIDAAVEFLPWGPIHVNRDINFDPDRFSAIPFADWTDEDAYGTPRTIDPNPNVGRADTDSATYNPDTAQVTFFAARAPGIAQGEAQATSTLPSQILIATTDPSEGLAESEQRIGDKFNLDNLREFLEVEHPNAYVEAPIWPSRSRAATWTLIDVGGPRGVNRVNYDDSVMWTVESITQGYNEKKGYFTANYRYRRVAAVGDPGDDITQKLPQPGALPAFPYLGLPAFNFQSSLVPNTGYLLTKINPAKLLNPPGRLAKADGNTMLIWSDTVLDLVFNFINLTYPTTRVITPPALGSFLLKSGIFDPFNKGIAPSTAAPQNGYIEALASDGTDSIVYSTPNGLSPVPAWLNSGSFDGAYTLLRGTGIAGSLMIYAPGGTPVDTDFNFTVDEQSWILGSEAGPDGQYIAGVGWQTTSCVGCVFPGRTTQQVAIKYTFSAAFISALYIDFTLSGYQNDLSDGGTVAQWYLSGSPVGNSVSINPTGTVYGHTSPLSFSINAIVDEVRFAFATNFTGGTNSTVFTVVAATLRESGDTDVRVLTNNGITVGSPITVGSTPGPIGGFDVQKSGGVSYAAAAGAIYKATTLGGAYSSWYSIPGGAQAVCLIIPYYRRNSSTLNTSVSDPDVIAACSNGKLYWLDGTAATATDISPSGVTAFDNANCVTVLRGNKIAVFGSVSGTYTVFQSQSGGTSWTTVGAVTSPTFIRDRRGDNSSAANRGQLWLANSTNHIDYSGKWDSDTPGAHILPITVNGFDVLG